MVVCHALFPRWQLRIPPNHGTCGCRSFGNVRIHDQSAPHAGRDTESKPYSAQLLGRYMGNADWHMRVCLFAAYSLSPHLSVRVASAYAHCSSPPIGSAARNKHVVILHDGCLLYYNNNSNPKNDEYWNISDDLNRAFTEVFKLGISCESEYVAPKDQDTGRATLSIIVEVVKAKIEQARLANRASSTIIVVLWSF